MVIAPEHRAARFCDPAPGKGVLPRRGPGRPLTHKAHTAVGGGEDGQEDDGAQTRVSVRPSDSVMVGAGPAGCGLANRLLADAGVDGRCFRVVDLMLHSAPTLLPVDKESDDQIVHRLGLRKADRPTHQPLDPRPQVEVLACNLLRVLCADGVLRGGDMPLIDPPAIGVKAGDATRLPQGLQAEKDVIHLPDIMPP
jgi:hypothetical protein